MTAQTAAYRAIAGVAARTLGRLEGVIGVYARRSVATGEVAFGRSDIDLHILIAPSSSAEAEGELLANLVARYNRMRRVAPVLGHAWVSTREDLERWYIEQPAEWYRDRAWLRLYGEEFERPRCTLDQPDD
jgi:predicted nucleotidyltransferase